MLPSYVGGKSSRLIDRVLSVLNMESVVALKNFTVTEPLFAHTDSRKVPESVLLDLFREAAGYLFSDTREYVGKQLYFVGVKSLNFISPVTAGDQLRIEIEKQKESGSDFFVYGKGLVDGHLVCDGVFQFELSQAKETPEIHPTASVSPSAILGKNVKIGPYSIIGDHVIVGDNCDIGAHVLVEKWTRIGQECVFHFGCVIGSAAQDKKYAGEESHVEIGDHNIFREYVTVNRPTGSGTLTKIGDHNFFLTNVHIGHNVEVGNNIVIANLTHIAGHIVIENNANIGGITGIHQFARIGRGAMVGGYSRLTQDVPPFTLCEGNPAMVRGLNVIGIRRLGFSSADLKEIKEAFRLLYRSGLNATQAVAEIQKLPFQSEAFKYFQNFIETKSNRGLTLKYTEEVISSDDD